MKGSAVAKTKMTSRKRSRSPPFNKVHRQVREITVTFEFQVRSDWFGNNTTGAKPILRFSGNFGSKVISYHLTSPLVKTKSIRLLTKPKMSFVTPWTDHFTKTQEIFVTLASLWWNGRTCQWVSGNSNTGLFLGPLSFRTQSLSHSILGILEQYSNFLVQKLT